MKITCRILILILTLSLTSLSGAKAAEVELKTEQTRITFTNFDNRELKLYFNDFVGSTQLCIRDLAEAFLGRYELSKPIGQPDNFYKFEIRPKESTANGTYSVFIRHCSSNISLELVIVVQIDAKALGLYDVEFELDCRDTNFGEKIYCYITGDASGPQYKSVDGDFEAVYFVRTLGTKKWKWVRSRTLGFYDGVAVSLTTISKPTEIRAKVAFENEIYELIAEVYPKPNLKIGAPRALIVGQSFVLEVTGSRKFSGKCIFNGGSTFKMVNGFGSIRLITRNPGKLDLTVQCSAPNWATSFAYEFIWVRD